MRNLVLVFVLVCLVQSAVGQEVIVPLDWMSNGNQQILKNKEYENTEGYSVRIDQNQDGEIQIEEALRVTSLSVNFSIPSTVLSYFSNLKYYNSIGPNYIDATVLPNLEILHCSQNQMSNLDVRQCPKLKELYFNNNHFA